MIKEKFDAITRYTRATSNGRVIKCPLCHNEVRVFHFSWGGLQCSSCNNMFDKEEWLVKDNNRLRTPYLRKPYYQLSDSVYEFMETVIEKNGIKDDEKLKFLVEKLQESLGEIRNHIDTQYIWD